MGEDWNHFEDRFHHFSGNVTGEIGRLSNQLVAPATLDMQQLVRAGLDKAWHRAVGIANVSLEIHKLVVGTARSIEPAIEARRHRIYDNAEGMMTQADEFVRAFEDAMAWLHDGVASFTALRADSMEATDKVRTSFS